MARNRECYEYSLSYPKFLLIGDSITERCFNQYPMKDYILDGYDHKNEHTPESVPLNFSLGSQLQHDYIRRLDIVNRGFSGYNSRNLKHMIENILLIEHEKSYSKCAIATLFLGTNDAASGFPDKCEFDEFIKNMDFIINEILGKNIKLILIGPTHHYPEVWENLNPDDVSNGILRTMENNLVYSNGVESLAKKYNLPFIDLYEEFNKHNEKFGLKTASQNLFIDGIHFNGDGYRILYHCLIDTINKFYPEYSIAKLGMRLPPWDDFELKKIKEIKH